MSCSVLPSADIINCASHWHFSRPDCLHIIHAFSDFFSHMSSCHLKQKTFCLIHVDKIPWNFCTSFSLSLSTFAQNWYIELGTWLDAVCMAWVFIRKWYFVSLTKRRKPYGGYFEWVNTLEIYIINYTLCWSIETCSLNAFSLFLPIDQFPVKFFAMIGNFICS